MRDGFSEELSVSKRDTPSAFGHSCPWTLCLDHWQSSLLQSEDDVGTKGDTAELQGTWVCNKIPLESALPLNLR